ncbi:hypothetical protein BAC3_01528 [uncultured bacterium]|nr:hypothetical protein BAC3_01528 [uncultured bacterium]
MTTAEITGYEKNIASIFSDEFAFEIPRYQRPYAWTTEKAEELLGDLSAYLDDAEDVEAIDPYFLGSIVLIKDSAPDAKVVDGQQRLTTLTILLAVLRYMADEKDRQLLTAFIYDSGNEFKGTSDRPRLRLRERDQKFFHKYIQMAPDSIAELQKLDPAKLTDSRRNIRNNALHLKSLLEIMDGPQRKKLAKFILRRCFLVVVAAPERDTAYRVFSVLNRRGMDLSPTDILKADIIGEIAESEQDTYTKDWEDIEEKLGREAFTELFAHLRMIYRKAKAKGTMLDELLKEVKPQKHPAEFIENTLLPLSEAFYDIKYMQYRATTDAEKINGLFRFLNQVNNFDWLPPAILYLTLYYSDPAVLLPFFAGLERLAACQMIMRRNTNERVFRYGALLTHIEEEKDLYEPDSPLLLSDEEKRLVLKNLNEPIYGEKYARYVLLRLDSLLTTGEAHYSYPVLSIEHVLPQKPAPNSEWLKWFSNERERELLTNQLGNLVLLSRSKNTQAQNYDFQFKKTTYFDTQAAPFALTAQVRDERKWTPPVIKRRQENLLGVLSKHWQLS